MLSYETNVPENVPILASMSTGKSVVEYTKNHNVYIPLYEGEEIPGERIALKNNEVILGNQGVVLSILFMFKNYELSWIEFDLFSDIILREGENDLFRRVGTYFICKNKDLGLAIQSYTKENKEYELVLEFLEDNIHQRIMYHPILKSHYIGTVGNEFISWVILNKITIPYLDMTPYDMLQTGQVWYDLSSIFTPSNYDSERFMFAFDILFGKDIDVYDGFRISSNEIIVWDQSTVEILNRTMGQMTIFVSDKLVDAIKKRYEFSRFKSRIFQLPNTYITLVHGYIIPELDSVTVDLEDIRTHILKEYESICKNDEDVVSLEKFKDLPLEDLLHLVPYHEDGFTFCFSDEYDINTNPYTRRELDPNAIKDHYKRLFTKTIP